MDLVAVEKNYRKFVRRFLIPILTTGAYTGPRKVQDGSSPKVENKGIPEFDWPFLIYGDNFSHSYKPVLQTFNMD